MIGDVRIETPLVLAPMAGVTNHSFRRLCRMHGAGLVVTELLSSHAIHYRNAKTFGMFDWDDSERPVSVQLFGGDPDMMAEAAQIVEAAGADVVDLNMGCWVPKVAKNGAGAALLKDVCLAASIIKSMVDAAQDFPSPLAGAGRAGIPAAQLRSSSPSAPRMPAPRRSPCMPGLRPRDLRATPTGRSSAASRMRSPFRFSATAMFLRWKMRRAWSMKPDAMAS